MTKKQVKKKPAQSIEASDDNVDKIRQILFGGQMRDYEDRFAELEARLAKTI